jgi:hypothetical protein
VPRESAAQGVSGGAAGETALYGGGGVVGFLVWPGGAVGLWFFGVGVGEAVADGVGPAVGVEGAEPVGVGTGDEATGALMVGVLNGSGCPVRGPTLGSVKVSTGPGGVAG